jgi:hypothetical protein
MTARHAGEKADSSRDFRIHPCWLTMRFIKDALKTKDIL